MIQTEIYETYYFTAAEGVMAHEPGCIYHASLPLLTFCVLVLRNGFTVTGESTCMDPAHFDSNIGRKLAREDAESNAAHLLAYAHKERLAAVLPAGTGVVEVSDAETPKQ